MAPSRRRPPCPGRAEQRWPGSAPRRGREAAKGPRGLRLHAGRPGAHRACVLARRGSTTASGMAVAAPARPRILGQSVRGVRLLAAVAAPNVVLPSASPPSPSAASAWLGPRAACGPIRARLRQLQVQDHPAHARQATAGPPPPNPAFGEPRRPGGGRGRKLAGCLRLLRLRATIRCTTRPALSPVAPSPVAP